MRIALVTPRFQPSFGGVETHVEELGKALKAKGHQLEVFTPNHSGKLPATEQLVGIKINRFRQLFRTEHLAFAPGITLHLLRRRQDFDVLHVHSYHATAAAFAALSWKGPVVFTPHYHGTGHTKLRALLHAPYRPVGHWLLRKSMAVIAVSEGEAELLKSDLSEISNKITVISNGVSLAAIESAQPFDQSKTCVGKGSIVVLSSGRLESYKRVDRIIDAIEQLGDPYHLVITGDGPSRSELETRIQNSTAAHRIHLLGRVSIEDLHQWRATAKVFVSLSEHEAQSVVLLEALAARRNCVASNIAAHRSVAELSPGAVQLVNPNETASEVAARISTAARLDDESKTLEVSPVPDWSTVAEGVFEIYSNVIKQSSNL